MTVHSTPLDAQVFQSLHGTREDGLSAAHHKRALDEFRVGGHDADEFVVGEVLAGNQLLVLLFFRAYRVLRLQSASAQDLLQLSCGERVLQVIHVLDILVGQETPDLAAGASGGLFVNDNLSLHRIPRLPSLRDSGHYPASIPGTYVPGYELERIS